MIALYFGAALDGYRLQVAGYRLQATQVKSNAVGRTI
jgi:hypothetical protein